MRKKHSPLARYWILGLVALITACIPKETGLPTLTATLVRSTPTPTVAQTQPALPSPTATPVTYVVQPGDSLSGIAARFGVPMDELAKANGIQDPNVIKVNQRLVIPGPTPVATATVPPTATPTPAIPPQLEIVDVIGRGAPSAETVIVVNKGHGLTLHHWTLRDAQNNAFLFPDLYLAPDAEVRIHTGMGNSTPQHLYWNRDTAVWEEPGDTVILADERGVIHATKPLD
jgi:LysM repeat protein